MFPWVRGAEAELKRLFAAYVEAKQQQQVLDYDDLLLYWQQMMEEPALAAAIAARFDHVLVDEYQDTNLLQAAILRAQARRPRPHRGRRRRAGDLFLPRRRGAQHPRLPGAVRARPRVLALTRNYRSTQPILDASNAVIAQAAERFTRICTAVAKASGHAS